MYLLNNKTTLFTDKIQIAIEANIRPHHQNYAKCLIYTDK